MKILIPILVPLVTNLSFIYSQEMENDKWLVACPKSCQCQNRLSTRLNVYLKTVNCTNAGLKKIPSDIQLSTQCLLLGYNHLTDLYDQLFPVLSQLKELDLSFNQIKQLGRGMILQNFTELRSLDLSYNDFRNLLDGVFRGLHRLEILIITHVQIKFIAEHVFDGLTNLKHLNLIGNQLHAIFPEWFVDLDRLEYLYLDDNYITYLNSGSFAFLKNLLNLSLSHNRIKGISHHAFDGLENLTVLNLSYNQLVKIPSASFQPIKHIRTLHLSGNSFSEIQTGDFVQVLFEHLSLDNISDLWLIDRGSFWDLVNLRVIKLHNNRQLQYIDPEAFINVTNIEKLYLHNNNLSALSEELMTSFRGNTEITLYDNPLLCDCNVNWIHQIINGKNKSSIKFTESEKLTCGGLQETKRHRLKEMDAFPAHCPPVLIGRINNRADKKMGDKHIFQCRAHGIPTPKIHWILPTGILVNETSNNLHLQLTPTGCLTIYHLKLKDSGSYTCVAENYLGETTGTTDLIVEKIDIKIFPLGVSSTYVTVVWNGTARNNFPEYEILYRLADDKERYRSVTVSQYFRSYTINNLQPETQYEFCIAVKSKESGQMMQIACTKVETRDENYMLQGIHHTSNVAVAAVLGIIVVMLLVICAVTVAARKYRQRHYDTPEKSLVNNMLQIPMENLHSPLMSHLGS